MSLSDLAGKSPEQQFAMIQKGLAGVRDETLRTATAMDIFGKSGGELKTLFADTGALGNAKQTIGTQADILARNATAFDRSSDLLAGMGKKLQGLFVGIADYVNPVLLPVLERRLPAHPLVKREPCPTPDLYYARPLPCLSRLRECVAPFLNQAAPSKPLVPPPTPKSTQKALIDQAGD